MIRIGVVEIALVCLVALIFLSPRNMLKMMRDIGRLWGKWSEFQQSMRNYLKTVERQIDEELKIGEKGEDGEEERVKDDEKRVDTPEEAVDSLYRRKDNCNRS